MRGARRKVEKGRKKVDPLNQRSSVPSGYGIRRILLIARFKNWFCFFSWFKPPSALNTKPPIITSNTKRREEHEAMPQLQNRNHRRCELLRADKRFKGGPQSMSWAATVVVCVLCKPASRHRPD